MKRFKKMMAIAIVAVMTLMYAVPTAFAAAGDLTVDAKVTVTGFQSGDTVTAYQFITWDEANNQWKVADGVGLTLNQITDGLTKEELGTLASHTDKMTLVTGTTTGATWEKTCGTVATAGSYLILVTDNNAEYVYNPAVVSADFDGESPNTVALTENTANIKKQKVTVDKKADNATDDYDVQVGDIVPFTVTVTVPQYNTNWTEPTFEVSDKLSTGLTIEVPPTIEDLTADDYTITAGGAQGDDGFTIKFSENYLKTHASTGVDIKYSAKVGDAVKDTAQVHEETNEVTVKFSNDPTNKDSHKEITDETHHYTFAIDASRFGSSSGGDSTSELLKVGVDKNGNPITAFTSNGYTLPEDVHPLAGAEFTLTGTGPNNTGSTVLKATSDANGAIFFNNLEVGKYTLQETKAPAGYMKDPSTHTVVVTAEYNTDGTLKSYEIKIDGSATSHYDATTEAETSEIKSIASSENNQTFPINNKKGAELPSTGGVGTTLFYLIGAILIIGAGVLLVTRRRVDEQ